MTKRLLYLIGLLCFAVGCRKEPENLSLTPESELLSAYLQAATCLVLKATPEEKAQLVAGLPFVDRSIRPVYGDAYLRDTALMDLVAKRRSAAEEEIGKILPVRCPATMKRLLFIKDEVSKRTHEIYRSNFVDLVAKMIAVNVAEAKDLQNYYELEYFAPGLDVPPY